MSQQLWKALHVLQSAADSDFERQRKLHANRFQCGRGCDACCHTPFVISEMEAAAISKAISFLPSPLVAALIRHAGEYLRKRLAVFSTHGYRQSRGELPPEPERVACPALVDGSCSIYEHRPTLCRRFGAALMDPGETDRVFACQLNFSEGESIDDAQLISAQRDLARQTLNLNQMFVQASGRRYSEPITVAHALLEDFQAYLPSGAPSS